MKENPARRAFAVASLGLFRYWLPFGFILLLIGLFLFPSGHNYKVALNYLLMVPALLACLAAPRWWPAVRRSGWLLAAILLYLSYMTGNALLQDPQAGAEFILWSIYIVIFLLAIGGCMEISPGQLSQLLWFAALVAAAAAAFAIGYDYHSGLLQDKKYRLIGYGALYNPLRSGHLFGAFAVVAFWCVLAPPFQRWQRYLAGVAVSILLLAVLFTASRAPLLGLLGVAIWTALGMAPKRQRWGYVVAIGGIAALSFWLFGPKLLERGLSFRPEIWNEMLRIAGAHLWFGVGLGADLAVTASDGVTYSDSHNIFLAALYCGGVVGLLLFVSVFGAAFWMAWRARCDSSLLALAAPLQMFGIATLQFDGGSLIGRPTEFWILYWLPVVITIYVRRQQGEV